MCGLHSRAGSFRHQKPCARQSQSHRFCCLHSSVSRLLGGLVYTPAATPPASASCRSRATCRSFRAPGRQPFALLRAAGADIVGLCGGQTAKDCAGFARIGVVVLCLCSWGSACSRWALCSASALVRAHSFGPFRPGPRRPSAFPLFWRSLPAAGSLGSPVRCTVKARHRPTRQTASGASAPLARSASLVTGRLTAATAQSLAQKDDSCETASNQGLL